MARASKLHDLCVFTRDFAGPGDCQWREQEETVKASFSHSHCSLSSQKLVAGMRLGALSHSTIHSAICGSA